MLFRPWRHLTLANFHLRPSNQHARAFALSLAVGYPRKHHPLLIVAGQTDRGKTHLLHAVANFAKQNNNIKSSNILSAKQVKEIVHKGIAYGDLPVLENRFRDCDFLVIDDVDELADDNFLGEFLLPILQERQSDGKVTLLSATLGVTQRQASHLGKFLDRQIAVYIG